MGQNPPADQGPHLVIFGATGGVGSRLIERLTEDDCPLKNRSSVIMCIASSRHYYLDPKGIDTALLKDTNGLRDWLKTKGTTYQKPTEVVQAIQALALKSESFTETNTVYVDAAVGINLKEVYQAVIRETESKIVAANKDVLALCGMKEFNEIVDGKRIRYQSTVCAGADAVRAARKKNSVSRPVLKIEGALSGTMGYICSHFDEPDFVSGQIRASQIIREAKAKGFTEPNPWDDLNGKDIARKVIILARSAGYQVEFSDIEILPLLPARFGQYEGEEFMEKIKDYDENLQKMAKVAAQNNEVLRYVGEMWLDEDGKVHMRAGLKAVHKDSELGVLKGSLNVVSLTNATQAQTYKKPGAGNDVTAEALQEDIEHFTQ